MVPVLNFSPLWLDEENSQSVLVSRVNETGSTSSDLMAWVKEHAITCPLLHMAEHQTAGRGTRGRTWANLGRSLTFSMAIPVEGDLTRWAPVALAIGASIVTMFQQEALPVRLKWPNDVLLNDKKLEGILVESTKDATGRWVFVVGVGTNLERESTSPNPEVSMDYGVAFLSDVTEKTQADFWLVRLARAILRAIEVMKNEGFKNVQDAWATISAYDDADVWVYEEEKTPYSARILGIDGAGRLLVRTENGDRALMSGNISLRKQAK